jgi:TonB C terminal
MQRHLCALGITLAAFASSGVQAQVKADFSDSWIASGSPNSTGTTQPVLGDQFTVKQDQRTFTIELRSTTVSPVADIPSKPWTLVYALDGSESKNEVPVPQPGQPSGESTSTASWQGSTLVITSDTSTTHAQLSFSLQPDGTLLVERATTMGAATSTVRTFYNRRHALDVKFDSRGVDFGPWLATFKTQIEHAWSPPRILTQRHAVVQVYVLKNGTITDVTTLRSAGLSAFDDPYIASILSAFKSANNLTVPLPATYPGDGILLTISFF